jgi:hypothetical protein
MPAFNAPQMGHCTKCNKYFQFTVAVRTIDTSSGGEVKTGEWKILGAPTIEEIHKNDILLRFGNPESTSP